MARELPGGLLDYLKLGFAESHSIARLEIEAMPGVPRFFYIATAGITHDTVEYTARLSPDGATSVLRQSLGEASDRADLQIVDSDNGFLTWLGEYASYLDGARVEIGRVWRNLESGQQWHKVLMRGVVTGKTVTDTRTVFQIISEHYAVGTVGGGRIATRPCAWEFKSRQCGYTGAETMCNKLLNSADGCSGRSNEHRFGGFVHIEGVNSISGAAGYSAPPAGTGAINNIPSGVYDVVRDYNATGNGVADDTAKIQNAIDAAYTAGGGTVWLPDKTFKVTGLVLKDKVRIQGAHWRKSQLYSTSNAPIITVSTTATDAAIEQLTVKGSVSAGGSQIGINANGNAEYSGLAVRDVWIEDCGDHGFYVGQYPFSTTFQNIHVSNCADYPFLLAATIAPGMSLTDCYAHVLRSGAAVGFRIKSGKWQLVRCNGTDNVPAISGTKWAVVGKKNGVDGDVAHGGASVEFVHCNIEAFHSHGVLVYYNSPVSFRGRCEFAGNNNDGAYKAIEFDLANDGVDYYAPFTLRGFLEDTVIFGGGFSNFANSQPIHANGMPPIQLNGQGPYCDGQGNARAAFYRHTPTSTDQALPRADGMFAVQTITGATTLQPAGARYIRCNHSATFTLTLPYAGWDARSQSPIVVVDVSSAGAGANKITINAAGGSTINGVGSVEIATNKGALTFLSDGNTDYRIVQGSTLVPMTDDSANGRITTPRRVAAVSTAIGAPAFTFEAESGLGMTRLSDRILAFATETTTGAGGVEALRMDGSGGTVLSLFSGATVGALVDDAVDLGQSGNYRFKNATFSRSVTSRDASFNHTTFNATTLTVKHSGGLGAPGSVARFTTAYSGLSGSGAYEVMGLWGDTFADPFLIVRDDGQTGFGVSSPTARIHAAPRTAGSSVALLAGSASATVPTIVIQSPSTNSGACAIQTPNMTTGSTNTTGLTKAVVVDSSGNFGVSSFGWQPFAQTASATIANTTTETTLTNTGAGSLTVAANTVAVGDTFEIELEGYWASSAGGTATLRIKLGSVTLVTSASLSLSPGSTRRWSAKLRVTVRTTGASGTVFAQGDAFFFTSPSIATQTELLNTGTNTIDFTANQALDATWQWSVANAGNTATCTNLTVKKWRA